MPQPTEPPSAFERLVADRGIAARPYQQLLAALRGEGATFDEIVRRTTLPRRAVEAALAALGDNLETVAGRVRLRPESSVPTNPAPDPGPGSGDRLPAGLLDRVEELIRHAPRPKHELDHVAATPETVARRAVALHRMYALAGRRVLLVGDRDLTSLALAIVDPAIEIAVADIDDDVLAYIDGRTEARARLHCYFADFRLGLPLPLRSWADLVVTDPPYTPDGIGLFVQRGLEGIADLGTGRLALAYGYGDQPKLGLKVQDALHDLRLAYEAVLPAFNRYVGAQAIGSASNLYLLRATSDTRRGLGRRTTGRRPNVYTHGRQSLEGGAGTPSAAELAALRAAASGPDDLPVVTAIGTAWPDDLHLSTPAVRVRRVGLEGCLFPGSPQQSPCATSAGAIVADLRHDSGSLLVRLLLATRAPRVAVLVRNQHPDITSAASQHALQATVGDKYALRYRRSFPAPQSAIVEAVLLPTAAPEPAGPAEHVAAAARRFVLNRPHGKLANVGREALIAATTLAGAAPLTKNAARTAVAAALPDHDLQASLLDLPRHMIDEVLVALASTAERLAAGEPAEDSPGGDGGRGGQVDVAGDDQEPVHRDGS